jgi:adenylate cyclase
MSGNFRAGRRIPIVAHRNRPILVDYDSTDLRVAVTEQHLERRLAAILVMDVAGYSRLMGVDEVGTLRALQAHRGDLIDLAIAAYHGRIVSTSGDGLLAEFASVVDAVACTVAFQRGMVSRNRDIPRERRIEFRAGINIGDVIVEGDDIHGDGVNVAQRLETLSEPGGVCISSTVCDQVRQRLPLAFADLGEQTLKNIAGPVRVYALGAADIAALPEATMAPPEPRSRRVSVRLGTVFAALLVVAAIGATVWHFYAREVPSVGWPSIAVLPFVNQSGDKDQDYFSDGLTDDLLTNLARIPHLIVLSRNATAKYKGKTVDISQIGRELGVRYMVEGSVRRASDQLRIDAALVETATDAQVWSDRYDRPTKEIFAAQDDITLAIAAALGVSIPLRDLERAKPRPPSSLSAYELFLRGREQILLLSPEGRARAIEFYRQALDADPTYADAMGALAQVYEADFALHRGSLRGRAAIDLALETAQHAFALDATSVYAARALSSIYLFTRRFDDAVAVLEPLLKFNPNNIALLQPLGDLYTYSGQPERGIEVLRQIYQLDQRFSAQSHAFIGRGLVLLNRQDEAIAELKRCALGAPSFRPCHEVAAVAYVELGRLDEARVEAMAAHRLDPEFTLASAPDVLPFKNPKDLQRFLDGLRKAGLPAQ